MANRAFQDDPSLKEAVREQIIEDLMDGMSLRQICFKQGMPDRRTVQRWQLDDEEFDAAITRARETGMHALAERAIEEAETAEDAQKGRLAFDAKRWYIGKLSNAFADKLKHEGGDPANPIRQLTEVRWAVVDPTEGGT